MKQLEVVAAILTYNGNILCMQRGKGKYPYVSFKYEFPGGKIKPGESRHAALERELREEMNIHTTIKESDLYMTVHHQYPDFAITMHAFYCPLSSPEFIRKEHIASCWLPPQELPSLDWAAADQPIMEKLVSESKPD